MLNTTSSSGVNPSIYSRCHGKNDAEVASSCPCDNTQMQLCILVVGLDVNERSTICPDCRHSSFEHVKASSVICQGLECECSLTRQELGM